MTKNIIWDQDQNWVGKIKTSPILRPWIPNPGLDLELAHHGTHYRR